VCTGHRIESEHALYIFTSGQQPHTNAVTGVYHFELTQLAKSNRLPIVFARLASTLGNRLKQLCDPLRSRGDGRRKRQQASSLKVRRYPDRIFGDLKALAQKFRRAAPPEPSARERRAVQRRPINTP